MDTTYTPTVIDVKPVGNNESTTATQGVAQSAKPVIPTYGTVQTVTDGRVEDVRYDSRYVILDKDKPATLASTKTKPAEYYDKDTVVTEETTVTLANGEQATFKPIETVTGDFAEPVTVTGTGGVTVNYVRFADGATIPVNARANVGSTIYKVTEEVKVRRGGQEITLTPAADDAEITVENRATTYANNVILENDVLLTPMASSQNTYWHDITYNTGDTIPGRNGVNPSLSRETRLDQIIARGDKVTISGKEYEINDTIPAGTLKSETTEVALKGEDASTIPAGTGINANGNITVTGTGGFTVNRIRYASGTTVPKGSVLNGSPYAPVAGTKVIRNGQEITLDGTQSFAQGDVLVDDYQATNSTTWNVTYKTGDVIPGQSQNITGTLASAITADQLIARGATTPNKITIAGTEYSSGTGVVLPNAVHLDPTTGAVTVVPRKYTEVTDTKIVIENEGTYELNQQTGEAAPTTGAADNTTYGVAGLSGKSDTDMTYSTADTIKSYTDRGFELAADGYTTDANGNTVARKFDTDSNTDQEYRVYLRHQKQTRQIKDTQEVKRTIEYKYANTDDVPATLRDTTAAPTETETLKFERDRIIDLAKAAELYPTEYATYKAVLDANGRAPEGDTNHAEYKARVVYYDHITNQAKAADATEAQKSAVSFGQWKALTSEKTLGTEKQAGTAADKQFDEVTSPDIAGYVPNNAVVESTGDIDPEAKDYTVTVVYTPAEQKLTINFSEVDANGNVITPGVASPIVKGGKSGTDFPANTADEVTAKITELTNKGYELVSNGYADATDKKFDTNASVDQVLTVTVRAKSKTVDPNKPVDPTKPADPETNPTPKPTDKVPNDPKNRTFAELGLIEDVTRTINYVYADGTAVRVDENGKEIARTAENAATYSTLGTADKVVTETKRFTRTAKINAATGDITEYGAWSADQTFAAVTSPTIANYTPTKESVAASTVSATASDIYETVIYNATTTDVDPNKPTDPTKPTDPNTNPLPKPGDKVPNDPKNRTFAELGLIETVTHTVNYKLADGSDAGVPAHTETLTFTRTAKIDAVTGAVSDYSAWTARGNDTTFDAVTTPVKDGYVASAKASTEITNVQATDNDSVETIIYSKLGSYVPVVPDGVTPPPGTNVTPTPYPDPTPEDPTKPGTPTTTPVVPHIPGTTPVGPDGKPLEPVTPGTPEDGYKVPPVPTDPTQNTTITYVKDGSQVAVVHFVDEEGNAVHTSVVEAGETGASFTKAGEVASIISELEARGYAVVANKAGQAEYPAENARIFDALDDKGTNGPSQVYYVTVGAKTIPVDPTKPTDPTNPENPKPGDPIDPNNPTGPKWTEDVLNKLNNIKSVNRTITYVKENGDEVDTTNAPKVTDKVTFTRVAIVKASDGSLLGYDTNGDGKVDVPATDTTSGWTAVNNDTTFDAVNSPVVKGYVLRDATQATIAETTGLTQDSADENIKVVYVPVGNIVPKVPAGETPDTPATPTPYPNDPQDPGKVVTPDPEKPTDPNDPTSPTTPVVPHVPGHTPKDPDGNPLKPVDPENPSKGYIPPVPKDPTKDTEINYDKDDQKAIIHYIVEGTTTDLVTDRVTGKSGEAINYSTATQLAKLYALGYELVSDGFTAAQDKNFDKDSSVDQEFTVVVKPKVVPVTPIVPTDPNEPVNPNKPNPGDPIDPENPEGPKWTEELINKLDNVKEVTRTITYVDEQNNSVATTVTDKVTFTREARVNVVTGEITYGNWVARNNDTTFDAVKSPVVKGYVLKDANQATIAETTGLTQDSADENIKVVYVPVGNIVPKVPNGETPDTPATPTPYPNDPQDPGKVVTPDPEKPTDPNDPTSPTTPVVPHVPGHTPKDPDGNPLKPVDPEDPSKGYIPPVPKDPTKDTEINYDKDQQKAVIKYVDQSTGKELSHDEVSGKTGEQIDYSTEDKIKDLIKQGYVVVTDEFTNNGPKSYDNVTDKDGQDPSQVFVVTVKPKVVPVTPIVPTDPNEPVNPNKPNPGDPIDPENPEGPKWTEELINKLDNVKEVTRTITYVDEQNNSVATTVTDKVTFTREARVNVVTGEITYGNWVARNNDTTFDAVNSPVVKGYILKDATQATIAETTGLTQESADENIKVVYVKLGSWIPQIPGQPTNPIVYPNDPTDPTKPGTDKPIVPYVPGHTPQDPNGNPLKPVDPKDPSKGYEVPDVPQDPTKDTIIKYVKDPKPQPQPQPEQQPQPEPEKPVTPTPVQPEQPVKVEKVDKQLPHTDAANSNNAAGVAMVGLIGAAVVARRKKEDK